ncbi:MAG: NfeD family protein [Cellulomonadaceae bacterium]|jgi:membrane protein implicated in regulation of membrane protease activity|nr:NfeD family protein [Cellulomonadaceae bacterium]
MDWLWWLGGAFALGLVEIIVLDVVVLALIVGALAGALAAALGAPIWVQVAVACIVAVLFVVLLRPWVMRKMKERVPLVPSGVAGHVGKPGVVVAEVTHDGGRVKIAGEVWTARLDDAAAHGGAPLTVGTEVTVTRIDGATAVVVPVTPIPTTSGD